LRAAIVVFIAGSALSGAAQSIGALIAFRTLQGLGAGGVMTLAMATVGDLVSPRERGRYQGYIQVTFVLASLVGPLLGGLFVDHLSWRWAFYVNVPVGALALAALTAYLHVPAQRRDARIDFLGAGLIAAVITTILLVTVWGGDRYAWSSPHIVGFAFGAVVLLAAFLWRERRASDPVLPLRLFRDPVFVVVSASLFNHDPVAVCGDRVLAAVPSARGWRQRHAIRAARAAAAARQRRVDDRLRTDHDGHRALQGLSGARARADEPRPAAAVDARREQLA
jgi:MFS family permease